MNPYTQIYVLFAISSFFFILIFFLICYYRSKAGRFRHMLVGHADYCDNVLEDQEHLLAYSTWKAQQSEVTFASPEELLRDPANREYRKILFEEMMVFFNIETAPPVPKKVKKRSRYPAGRQGGRTRDSVLIPLRYRVFFFHFVFFRKIAALVCPQLLVSM